MEIDVWIGVHSRLILIGGGNRKRRRGMMRWHTHKWQVKGDCFLKCQLYCCFFYQAPPLRLHPYPNATQSMLSSPAGGLSPSLSEELNPLFPPSYPSLAKMGKRHHPQWARIFTDSLMDIDQDQRHHEQDDAVFYNCLHESWIYARKIAARAARPATAIELLTVLAAPLKWAIGELVPDGGMTLCLFVRNGGDRMGVIWRGER